MPAVASATDLVQALVAHRLLEPERLSQLAPWAAKFRDPKALAKDLVQRGWLTPYQVNQLVQGKGGELGLGNYVLLERLGEGGMGQVFKARHRSMGRHVAIKVMRKELTSRPDTVRRFRREIMAAASLHHPNIVLAFDADQVGDTHFFVMEFVEGIDLGKLVKTRGPMTVREGCDSIRQAAMGLQHAFENNLVHRDIKPTNLLRAKGGVIKLLDMGLARLQEVESDSSSNLAGGPAPVQQATQLTQAGKVMGTPDFIAPEQARNSHTVDIRADLYSLGCTFHFLLTGKVPFPGGSMIEKLFKHQAETAQPVESIRPEVPAAVGGIIRKLMAKRPDDRFQTPSELAAALIGLTIPAHMQHAASATMVSSRMMTAVPDYPVPTATPVVASAALNGSPAPQWKPAEMPVAPLIQPAYQRRRSFFGGWALFAWMGGAMLLASLALLVFSSRGGPSTRKGTGPAPASRKSPPSRRAEIPVESGGTVYLSDLPEMDVVIGMGRFGKNGELGYDNRRIVVQGTPSSKGISLPPPARGSSQVSYRLDRQFQSFRATAALNDLPAAVKPPTLIFEVYGDDQLLWKSPRPVSAISSQECNISVANVDVLKLTVRRQSGNTRRAEAVWVDPRLVK